MKLTYNNLQNWKTQSALWRGIDNVPRERATRKTQYAVPEGKENVKWVYSGPYLNVWWHEIGKEFAALFGKEFKMYEHIDLSDGISIYIHTAINECLDFTIKFTVHYARYSPYNEQNFSLRPNGNMEYIAENIRSFVMDYVNKNILFGAGKWRDMQLSAGCSKGEIIAEYKSYLENKRRNDVPVDTVIKSIKKHCNVDVSNTTISDGLKWIGKHGKQAAPVVLFYTTDDWLMNIDGDIDELERGFWEYMEQYPKNAVFIA